MAPLSADCFAIACRAMDKALPCQWADWFNNRRLLEPIEPIGYITPAEAEEAFYANINTLDKVA